MILPTFCETIKPNRTKAYGSIVPCPLHVQTRTHKRHKARKYLSKPVQMMKFCFLLFFVLWSQGSVIESKLGKCNSSDLDGLKSKGPAGRNSRTPSALRTFLTRNRRGSSPPSPHSFLNRFRPKQHQGRMMSMSVSGTGSAGAGALDKSNSSSCTCALPPRKGSSGSRHFIIIEKGRAPSQSSVRSTNNSISNSSLQDMDESEYTGEELASCLARMNQIMGIK
jgi:hypothetical protein